MAVSALNTLREYLRQQATGDDKYFTYKLMFFELKIPDEVNLAVGLIDSYLFALRVPPDSYSLDEPFTVEATPTQGGGLYVEENGIAQRMIRLSGTTGFAPRARPGNAPAVLASLAPEKRSYTRKLNAFPTDALSGHAQFMYLQDAVFRLYADLKRDPATAEDTRLIFHIPKDDEHWLVVPQRFQLERTGRDRILYRYNIDLLVVDRADANDEDFSEDGNFLDAIKDAIATVNMAVQLAQGAINDLTALVAEIKSFISDIAAVIDGVAGIIDAAKNFVEGVTDLIESPLAILESLSGVIDSASSFLETWEESSDRIGALPDKVKQKWNQLGEALDMLGMHPETFEPDNNTEIEKNSARENSLISQSNNTLTLARGLTVPSTLAGYNALGTQMTPGDVQESEAAQPLLRKGKKARYKSATQIPLSAGETLASLAAKYLKDARKWRDIATINGLKPPFTNAQASLDLKQADEAALPGVKGIGDKILIPSLRKAQTDLPNLVTLGVKPDESAEVRFLGRDFRLEVVSTVSNPGNPHYDIPIDTARGGVDLQLVSGLDNLAQGLTQRIATERGTDILYKRLGMQRIIGMNQVDADLELTRFRAVQALQQDPRVANVRRVVFEGLDGGTAKDPALSPDTLVIDTTVEVRGFAQSSNVRIAV